MDWVQHWTDKSVMDNDKISNGRNYPDSVLIEICNDLINILSPYSNKSILDVGGGNGHFLKYIITKCNPSSTCLIDASPHNVKFFMEWIKSNNVLNASGYVSILPEFPVFKNKFDIIMCGTTLGYLSSYEDVRKSIKHMYDLLLPGGNLLLFHHFISSTNESNVLTFDFNFFNDISIELGFNSINNLKIGPYYKNGCCGANEISILFIK